MHQPTRFFTTQTRMWLALALLLALIAVGALGAGAQTPPTAPNPAQIDLLALEREILTEINKLRTNPAGMAATLVDMKNNATLQGRDPVLTYPSGQRWVSNYTYLNSAISDAQRQAPLLPLSWAEGLYQAAHNYAIRLPNGHADFGTTLGGRTSQYGSAAGGVGEGIMYGGNSAFEQVAGLYIDAGVPSLGHRKALVNPNYTHVGVGCGYNPRTNNITCVVNYGDDWTEKSDEVKPEFNKQFAFREKDGQFRYAILKPSTNRSWAYEVHPCPGNVGWIWVPDAAGLTTVEQAQAEGLTATNAPCNSADVPNGVLNNGTARRQAPTNVTGLPNAAAPAGAATQAPLPTHTPAPTLTPQPTSPPPPTPTAPPPPTPDAGSTLGGTLQLTPQAQYAYQTGPDTFQYVVFYYTRFRSTATATGTDNYFDICPTAFETGKLPSDYDLTLSGPNAYTTAVARSALAGSELEAIMRFGQAWSAGLRPTNEPCYRTVYDTRNPLKERRVYALVDPSGGTFRYAYVTTVSRGSLYNLSICPISQSSQRTTIGFAEIGRLIAVSDALGQGLTATNPTCQNPTRPNLYPLGD